MARLILHIGTHKTGTTAIQHWLHRQGEALAAAGWHYGATTRPPQPRQPKHNSLFRAAVEGRFAVEQAAILADHAASGLPNLILSEEGLSLPAFERFAPLQSLAASFDITVVAMVRRQDIFLESHWKQLCQEGLCGQRLEDFVTSDWNRRRMRYDEILAFWGRFARLRVARYDPAHPAGAVGQFLELAGLDIDPGPRREANPSLSYRRAAGCAWLTRHQLRPLVPWAARLWSAGPGGSGLSPALRRLILAEVAPINARLAESHGLCLDDPPSLAQEGPFPEGRPAGPPPYEASSRGEASPHGQGPTQT